MDSFQLWKDDYRREVEDVLLERRRSREKGERPETAPGEGFGGRFADLIIPPAGVHAEAAALRSRLAEAEASIADLRRRAEAAETASARERDRRERIKDAASSLAVELRGLQAELLAARGQSRLASERVADAERLVREARMDAEHASARAEDAERASTARLQLARELHARFDALQIETEAAHSDVDWEAARASAEQVARTRAELRAEVVRREAFETALRQESLRAAAAERASKEAGEAAQAAIARADGVVDAALAEGARAQEDAAALRCESERVLAEARRLESEIPSRVAAAIGDERATVELARTAAASALAKVAALEKESLQRRADAERHAADAAAFSERLDAERLRAENAERGLQNARVDAERELANARRDEAWAAKQNSETLSVVSLYRDRVKEIAARITATTNQERARIAEAQARIDAEAARQAAVLEEERARLRAEIEEERGRLEAEVDAERAGLQERWREQAELLEKLRQARGRDPEA